MIDTWRSLEEPNHQSNTCVKRRWTRALCWHVWSSQRSGNFQLSKKRKRKKHQRSKFNDHGELWGGCFCSTGSRWFLAVCELEAKDRMEPHQMTESCPLSSSISVSLSPIKSLIGGLWSNGSEEAADKWASWGWILLHVVLHSHALSLFDFLYRSDFTGSTSFVNCTILCGRSLFTVLELGRHAQSSYHCVDSQRDDGIL